MELPSSLSLQALLEGTRHPILVLGRDGTVLEANRATLDWLGIQREEAVGAPLWDLSRLRSAHLRTEIEEALQCAASGDRQAEVDILRRRLGIRAVGSGNDAPLFLAEETDLSGAESQRQRARLAFETANVSVWTWDLDTGVVNSESDRGIFGLPAMVDFTIDEAMTRIHPEDRAYLLAEAAAAIESRTGFRVEVRGWMPGTERTKWVSAIGIVRCNEEGRPVRMEGITVDITEHKETEFRLRESEARFRAIFENAGIGIALVSQQGVPLESNPALERLLGYSAAELRHMGFPQFTHNEDVDRDWKLYQELMAGKRARYEVEKRYLRKNGEIMWGKLVVSLVRDPQGQPEFGIGMVENITEKKLVEQEVLSLSNRLIHAQEEERSRIARELHDDLGQQIAALAMNVASLKRRIPKEETERRSEVERLQEKIDGIATGLRRISHELHPAILELAGLTAALRSHCAHFSTDNGIEVSLEAVDDCEEIPVEAALCVYRVAQEALRNVAKHSGAKSAVVRLEHGAGAVTLTVTDAGRGFDMFGSTSHPGLGLVSMRERAALLKGTIEVHSIPGDGTSVRVTIPIAAKAAA